MLSLSGRFPSQPLVHLQGAASTIFATTVAASIAYSFSKGLGRKFAQQMIDSEIGDSKGNAAKRALNKVQQSVEKGSFWQQYSAVLALRLTPVVPFRCFALSRKIPELVFCTKASMRECRHQMSSGLERLAHASAVLQGLNRQP